MNTPISDMSGDRPEATGGPGGGRPTEQPILQISGLAKHFRKGDTEIVALRDFDLTVQPGSFVTILGRSGCGKSTLLNLTAGLTAPTAGTISYRGEPVTTPRKDLGYLTQSDTLMPWRDVLRNVEMPLELAGVPKGRRRARAATLIDAVGLSGFEHHYPRELSGGMRRRASLARMLCSEPDTLLLDEPFGALDAQLRAEMQRELLRLWVGTGRTVLFVTHDIEEAALLGDRVIVLGGLGRRVLDLPVTLARPRDIDALRTETDFIELCRSLAAALKDGTE